MDKSKRYNRDAVVSDAGERLIMVDENDQPFGYASKAECHSGDGLLHRAFSLFVLDARGWVLMQQRSANKPLWPLHWSNSCCSHPREGESMEEATQRRLEQELGFACDLKYLFKFRYREHYRNCGSEHEFCWVYLGRSDDPVRCNRNEIAAWCFVRPSALDRLLVDHPGWFTPWFRMEWQRLMQAHRQEFEVPGDITWWRETASARLSV